MFKPTVSEIGDVRCVKLSADELVVDSESYNAQGLIHSLSVGGESFLIKLTRFAC
jgi:hypothetical protein